MKSMRGTLILFQEPSAQDVANELVKRTKTVIMGKRFNTFALVAKD